MKRTLWITLAVLIGSLTFGATGALAQYCGDAACNGGELPSTCPGDCALAGCGDLVCTAGETPQNCSTDCGSCNCAPAIDGPLGSRCTSSPMTNGQANIPQVCDQEGACTATCTQGVVTFPTNTCNPWDACAGGTNGAGGTICTYPATNHGDLGISGACNNNGTCSVSCNDGTPTVSNLCTAALANCAAGSSGSGGAICSYPATNHGQTGISGACNNNGTCSVSCNDGTPTVSNSCTAFVGCSAGTNGSGSTQCSYPATSHGQLGVAGACAQAGTCSVSCNDGTPTVSNSCTPSAINGQCGTANGGKFNTAPTGTPAACNPGTQISLTSVAGGWQWVCQGSGGGSNSGICSATAEAVWIFNSPVPSIASAFRPSSVSYGGFNVSDMIDWCNCGGDASACAGYLIADSTDFDDARGCYAVGDPSNNHPCNPASIGNWCFSEFIPDNTTTGPPNCCPSCGSRFWARGFICTDI